MKRAIVTCRDLNNEQFLVIIENCLDLSYAKQIADFIEGRSSCEILTYAFVEEIYYKGKEPQENGHYDRADQHLKCIFLNGDDGSLILFYMPAPNDVLVTADQEPDQDFVTELKNLLLNTTDVSTLIYRGGGVISK